MLGKLHVTPNLGAGITPIIKLQQKLLGLCYTDRQTPIIRNIIIAAERLGMSLRNDEAIDFRIASHWSKYAEDVNWPNVIVDDELDVINTMLPEADVNPLFKYLGECKCQMDLLTMPTIQMKEVFNNKHKLEVAVVDGEITQPQSKSKIQELKARPLPAVPIKKKPNVSIHDQYVGREICKKYLQRACKGKCELWHVKICEAFQKGACKRAKDCKYEHVKVEM